MFFRTSLRGIAGAAAAVLATATAACLPAGAPEGRPADWVVAPLLSDPESLNFVLAGDGSSKQVASLIAEGLVDHDENLQFVPRLATTWVFSPDQRTLTFTLRHDVRWHDGEPFTAADVRFTFERILDPAGGALSKRSLFLEVERLETPDPHTVRVVYRKPFAAALVAWETPLLPEHRFRGEDFLATPRNRDPVGTGPYRFLHWKTAQEIVLEANRDYWRGEPPVRRVIFRIIPSRGTQYRALLAGEIDLAVLEPEDWGDLEERPERDRFRLLQTPTLFLAYIAWNGDGSHPALGDPRVRRALTLLTDRYGYLERVLLGFGRVAASFHPVVASAEPDVLPLPFDPNAAGRLLDEAGWRVPPGGRLRTRAGTEFRIRMQIASGIDWQERFSAFLQEGLRRAGIDLEILRLDATALVGNLRQRNFEAALSGFTMDLDPDPYPVLHSSQIGAGVNYAGYRNPDVDRLLDRARETVDLEARRQIYREVTRILAEDQPYTFLWFRSAPLAVHARFENVRSSPLGLFRWFPAILDWRVSPQPRAGG